MKKLGVLLVEDHPLLRLGLRCLIESQPDLCLAGEATDAATAVRLATETPHDVIVMGISFQGLGASESTAQLRHADPLRKILVMSDQEDLAFFRTMIDSGANGYILKRAQPDEILRAIRSVGQGSTYIEPAFAGQLVASLKHKDDPGLETLSNREKEVLIAVAQGYALKEIAGRMQLGVRTVETYKKRGMEKLNLKCRADLIHFALSRGWLRSVQFDSFRKANAELKP